jgi:CRP-like cAMP-binding protein
MALLDHGPRQVIVVTGGPSEVLVLYGNEFRDLMDASPPIAKKPLTALAERARANATPRH